MRGRSCALRASPLSRRLRSSSELARRSRRTVRRARGRARERRRNRGAMRRRATNRQLRPVVELAERLAALAQSLDDADPAAAAARTRTPSEAESVLAWALLGRALEENDRAAAERSRAFFAAQSRRRRCGDAGGTGRVAARSCLQPVRARGLFGGHRNGAARTEKAPRAGGHARDGDGKGVGFSLHHRDLRCAGEATPTSGISLVSAARRMYREHGVVEEALRRKRFLAVSRRARGRLWATRATRPRFAAVRPWPETRQSRSR